MASEDGAPKTVTEGMSAEDAAQVAARMLAAVGHLTRSLKRAESQLTACAGAAEGRIDEGLRNGMYDFSLAYARVAPLRQAFDRLADGRSVQEVLDGE